MEDHKSMFEKGEIYDSLKAYVKRHDVSPSTIISDTIADIARWEREYNKAIDYISNIVFSPEEVQFSNKAIEHINIAFASIAIKVFRTLRVSHVSSTDILYELRTFLEKSNLMDYYFNEPIKCVISFNNLFQISDEKVRQEKHILYKFDSGDNEWGFTRISPDTLEYNKVLLLDLIIFMSSLDELPFTNKTSKEMDEAYNDLGINLFLTLGKILAYNDLNEVMLYKLITSN